MKEGPIAAFSSEFFGAVSDAEEEMPGETTSLVRAFASVLVQELNETASSSSGVESHEVRSFRAVTCSSSSSSCSSSSISSSINSCRGDRRINARKGYL